MALAVIVVPDKHNSITGMVASCTQRVSFCSGVHETCVLISHGHTSFRFVLGLHNQHRNHSRMARSRNEEDCRTEHTPTQPAIFTRLPPGKKCRVPESVFAWSSCPDQPFQMES